MRTAYSAMVGSATKPELLPVVKPFDALRRKGAYPARGQVVLFAARPGGMKSTMATSWVLAMAAAGTRSLVMSMDQSPRTAMPRVAAAWTGRTVQQVKTDLANSASAAEWYSDRLRRCPVAFCFGPKQLGDIALELDAHLEFHGLWPDVIVVDNLVDLVPVGEGHSAYVETMRQLGVLATVTGSSVWVLHHCRESKDQDPGTPPSRGEIANLVSQVPELIFLLGYADGVLRVATGKNRDGQADPSGKESLSFTVDPTRGMVTECLGTTFTSAETQWGGKAA